MANIETVDLPAAATLISLARWLQVNADVAREACATLGYDSLILDAEGRRVPPLEAEAERLLADAVDLSADKSKFRMLGGEGLTDAEIVWCSNHRQALLDAADALGIGIEDSPDLDVVVTVSERGSDFYRSWTVRDLTSYAEQYSVWFRYHVDWVARDCSAAFDAR